MANYKIIGGDLKEYGPATADELRQWIVEGRAGGQSLVQLEGTDEWRPLSSYVEFTAALQAQGGQTPPAETPHTAPGAEIWKSGGIPAVPRVEIANCLARSGQLVASNFGLIIGASTLAWILSIICQFLPFIGVVLYPLLQGAIYGGLYLVFLRRIRGEPASISGVFEGFSSSFAQLMIVGLLTSLLSSLGFLFCAIPGIYLFVAWTFAIPLVADKRLEFWEAMERSRRVVTRVWFPLALLLILAFLPVVLMYIYEQVKIFDVSYPAFQELMRSGQPDVKRLMEIINLIAKTSVPLVLIGKIVLLVNLPFAVGALMYAYEDLFGARKTPDA